MNNTPRIDRVEAVLRSWQHGGYRVLHPTRMMAEVIDAIYTIEPPCDHEWIATQQDTAEPLEVCRKCGWDGKTMTITKP